MADEIMQVRTEAQYDAALARITELLDAEINTPEGEELDRITTLVEIYEDEHYPMEKPEPAPALEFLLDQKMVSRERMMALAGDGADLDAILAGEAPIPPGLAGLLREELGIVVEDMPEASAHPASAAVSD